jgi:uncharacterized membrane protein
MTGPVKTRHHFAQAISIRGLRAEMQKVDGVNAKIAVFLTNMVGSMWCAYAFCVIALLSLPAILTQTGWIPKATFPTFLVSPGLIAIVAWVAQTFIQLVLLSVIMVGQSVQSAAADARAVHTFDDTEFIKNQVNEHTDGGIKAILDRLDTIEARLPT